MQLKILSQGNAEPDKRRSFATFVENWMDEQTWKGILSPPTLPPSPTAVKSAEKHPNQERSWGNTSWGNIKDLWKPLTGETLGFDLSSDQKLLQRQFRSKIISTYVVVQDLHCPFFCLCQDTAPILQNLLQTIDVYCIHLLFKRVTETVTREIHQVQLWKWWFCFCWAEDGNDDDDGDIDDLADNDVDAG